MADGLKEKLEREAYCGHFDNKASFDERCFDCRYGLDRARRVAREVVEWDAEYVGVEASAKYNPICAGGVLAIIAAELRARAEKELGK